MHKKIKINADPSEQRHTTTRDEDGNKVHVYDSGGTVDVVDDRKTTVIRPDGSTSRN